MTTLSTIALTMWLLFGVFVLTSLANSNMRIYWLWLGLAVVACALLANALRVRRRLTLVTVVTAVLFLASFVLYWIAMSSVIYDDSEKGLALGSRLQNVVYVVVGNFQQGQVWLGLQSAFIQLLMPSIQVAILLGVALISYFGRGTRTT